jgi:hypothetical protein
MRKVSRSAEIPTGTARALAGQPELTATAAMLRNAPQSSSD